MQKLRDQAERFGTRFITDQATKVELADEPGGIHKVWVGDDEYQARTVILAMGAEHKKLGVPGEEELGGAGVSYCATCDAAFFKEHDTIIVGGGDSRDGGGDLPGEVRLQGLRSSTAATSSAPRRSCSSAPARSRTSSSSRPYVVEEFHEGEGAFQRVARLRNAETGEERELAVRRRLHRDRPRAAVGHRRGPGATDDEGYVITEGKSTRTGVPGVFAAGDLVDHTYRQAVTAAGSGCQAALDAEWYLRDTPAGRRRPRGMPEGDLAEAQWAPRA